MYRYPTFKETHLRSVTRSVLWRIMGILLLALITYIVTHNWIVTSLITVLHHVIFIGVYYLHERFWLKVKWLRTSKWKPLVRIATYELILGNLVLAILCLIFTGSLQKMATITFIYIGNKLWIYYAWDYLWSKIKWQTV